MCIMMFCLINVTDVDLYNTNHIIPDLELNKLSEDLKELHEYLKFNIKRMETKLNVSIEEEFGSLESRYR